MFPGDINYGSLVLTLIGNPSVQIPSILRRALDDIVEQLEHAQYHASMRDA